MGSYLEYLEKYLLINLWHSFDHCNFKNKIDKIIEVTEDSFFYELFSILKEFHENLSTLRYDIEYLPDNIHKNNETKKTIDNNKIKKLIDEKHDDIIKKINGLAKKIQFFEQASADEYCPEAVETSFILEFYETIEEKLTELIDSVQKKESLYDIKRKLKKSANKNKSNSNNDKLLLEFYNKFIDGQITDKEKKEWTKSLKYLTKKQKRYQGEDRLQYWKGEACRKRIDFKKTIENLIIGKASDKDIEKNLIQFICFILSKYHMILHKYYTYDYKFIYQYFETDYEQQEKEIRRAQKIFTFARLITKYFHSIFDRPNIHDKNDKRISTCLNLLTYLRRGFAYLLLDNPEKAFNDFTKVEKCTKNLREGASQVKDNISMLYGHLMLPYTYSLKGELYRRNFSFYNAHQYFCNSITKLEDLKNSQNENLKNSNNEDLKNSQNENIKEILDNSITLIRIKINKGKTFLELGEFKKSLKWFLKALLDYVNITKIDNDLGNKIFKAIEYLEETKLDTHITKNELYSKIELIISDLQEKNEEKSEYPLLFSDICTRIAIVLTLLKLPNYNKKNKKERHDLALKWLELAHKCLHKKKKKYYNALTILNCLIISEKLKGESPNFCGEITQLLEDGDYELIHFGGLRDIIYRILAINTLKSIKPNEGNTKNIQDWKKDIARRLLQSLLIYTEDFSIKNAELYRYLMKERKITSNENERSIYIYGLQRWSSINPALVRPSAFKIKGGGMLIIYKGKGIVIDPGINFIENLYSEGFSIADIDYVIATHDHIDHIADLDTLMSLYYRRHKIEGSSSENDKNPLTLILNPSVSARYSFLINQNPELFRKIELSSEDDWRTIFEDFQIKAITVDHFDLSAPKYSNTLGLILSFGKKFKIGITSDTFYKEEIIEKFTREGLNIFIVHINSVPFRELKAACDISIDEEICEYLKSIKKNEQFKPLLKEILYSLGYDYDDFDPDKENKLTAQEEWNQLFNGEKPVLGQHLLLYGTLKTFEKFIKAPPDSGNKLFLISEISEEMGNYRSKVARYLNDHFENEKSKSVKCLTLDIGMCIRIKDVFKPEIEIRCSECRLSNDHDEDDIFHPVSEIKEVCIKQEEEGLFYFCPYHDPEGPYKKIEEYEFAERLERYQPFRHIDIRIT